jgi:hypothetical protein
MSHGENAEVSIGMWEWIFEMNDMGHQHSAVNASFAWASVNGLTDALTQVSGRFVKKIREHFSTKKNKGN